MTMHDVYRVGSKWLHFAPQYYERAYCKHCGNCLDSIEHIMTACSMPGQKEIWDLTKLALEQREIPWSPPSLATVLTSTSSVLKSLAGNWDSGREHFYQIIMTSSVQVIWNVRCKQVIQQENVLLHPEYIQNMWLKKINRKLELDCLMMHDCFRKKALQKDHVMRIWSGSILNKH